MKNYYEVMNNENTITNGEYSVRWTGSKLAPEFVAHDIAKAIGYKNPTMLYHNILTTDYVDADRGKKGRILMRSVSISQVNSVLEIKNKRLKEGRDAFREFWEDYVLPEFDHRYARIAAQKKELARKEAEISRLKEENATLFADLSKANEKIISIKSLVA